MFVVDDVVDVVTVGDDVPGVVEENEEVNADGGGGGGVWFDDVAL